MSTKYKFRDQERLCFVTFAVIKGIGKKLLYEAEHWSKEINSDKIVLNSGTREERQDAYIFYQKMGYIIKSSGFVKILVRDPGQLLTAK